MRGRTGIFAAALAAMAAPAAPALAAPSIAPAALGVDDAFGGGAATPQIPYLQCVPYARQVSGIRLYGDAHTWWDQAAGRYARGNAPRPGAVMSFKPYANMRLGHVAAVSRVIDSRTVLLRHANWSPIGGRRGQIEDDVRAIDVSPNNDWSEVRVWFAPIQGLGTTRWPINGFIYPDGAGAMPPQARTTLAAVPAKAKPSRIGLDFLDGIVPENRESRAASLAPAAADDPIGALIASRS